MNQFAAATEQLYAAVQVLESLRNPQLTDAQKRAFYDTQARTFRLLQLALIGQNDIPKALEISERGRARAFVELLANQQTDNEATPVVPPPLTVAQIQQIAKAENATLVQYSNIFDRFLYIYVIQPTGEVAFRQVPLGNQTEINPIALLNDPLFRGGQAQPTDTVVSGLVNGTRSALRLGNTATITAVPTGENSPDHRLRELHKLLIEPIADLLPSNPTDRIIFVPQGSLFLVPFPALNDANGDYLIQHHTVLTAPSIQVLTSTRQQRSTLPNNPDNVLVVGNPTMPTMPNLGLSNLPGAEREAEAIAQFFDTQAMIGSAATETQIVQQMAQAQIIHLATHGLFDYGDPQASGIRDLPGAIALAPSATDDGLLTAAEILQLQLKAQLVVLSACDTGRGEITGDGVVGLSRSLISAGVPSIIVSLWSVPDAPTSYLMTEFYRQWQQNPDKAQALRQAMLITMKDHRDPRDWAAFTLIGASN
jgi:CHAT domain-containing protein